MCLALPRYMSKQHRPLHHLRLYHSVWGQMRICFCRGTSPCTYHLNSVAHHCPGACHGSCLYRLLGRGLCYQCSAAREPSQLNYPILSVWEEQYSTGPQGWLSKEPDCDTIRHRGAEPKFHFCRNPRSVVPQPQWDAWASLSSTVAQCCHKSRCRLCCDITM